MKKILLSVSLALGAMMATAASPDGVWQTIAKHSAAHRVAAMATDGEGEETEEPETPEVEPNWVSIGECAYTDEAVYSCWSVGPQTYSVDLEYDTNHPGMYRIVNPWKNYPASARQAVEQDDSNPGQLLIGDEYYILINATDPDKVYIEESPIGIVYTHVVYGYETGGDNEYTVVTCKAYGLNLLVGKYGITEDRAASSYGKLTDNVIKFPTYSYYLIAFDEDGEPFDYYMGNKRGNSQLVLDGTVIPVNYDFDLIVKDYSLCPSALGNYQFRVDGDENIPLLRYAVVEESPEFPIAHTEVLEKGKTFRPGEVIVVNTDKMPKRIANVMVIAYDEEGEEKNAAYFPVYNHGFEADQWENFGTGTMTEGILSGIWPSLFDPTDFEVQIEKHKTRPDYYRVVDPYKNYAPAEQYLSYGHSHTHHLYINAADPDNVYIENSILGLEMLDSEVYLSSDWGDLMDKWSSDDYEKDKSFFESYWGLSSSGSSFENGILTFALPPVNTDFGGIYIGLTNGQQGWANLNGKFKLVFHNLYKESGIDAVGATEADSAVYDLQGRKLAAPAKGINIIGGKKVLVK